MNTNARESTVESLPSLLPEDRLDHMVDLLYGRCAKILKDPERARDAVQEVLTRFYEVAQTRDIKEPIHYLFRMSTNYCITQLKTKQRWIPVCPMSIQERKESKVSHQAEHTLTLQKIVEHFGEDAAQLLVHRHLDRMTYHELGALYERSHQGMKKRLDKLHEKINAFLVEECH